jgi:hypothetical protein
MLSAIDDIEARNRKDVGVWVSSDIGIVLPERNTPSSSSSFTGGKGDCDDERFRDAKVELVPCE